MILAKVKTVLYAIWAGITAAAAIFGLYQKAARETERRKAIEGARDVERRATEAMIEGERQAAKGVNDALDDYRTRRRRDHFT